MTEWPPIGKTAVHSAYDVFSWYKYLIVNLVFSHLGFWKGNLSDCNLFLIFACTFFQDNVFVCGKTESCLLSSCNTVAPEIFESCKVLQFDKKVQVGKDQEKVQSEKDSHSTPLK